MVTCPVSSGSLSSLLDTRGCIEIIAEPYRLQKDVVLCVAYSEYVNYIRALPEDSSIRLLSGTRQTVQYCNNKDPKLYKSFLVDIAFAICKELLYSERVREDATVIVPVSDDSAMSVSKFLRIVTYTPNSSERFERLLQEHDHSQRIKMPRNKLLKQLALGIFSLSEIVELHGELCLAYDL